MFKVGDKVIVLDNAYIGEMLGLEGIVVCVDDTSIGVDFGAIYSWAHDLDYVLNENTGRWMDACEIKVIKLLHVCPLICKCNAKEAITF